jgi:hypothetical protein
MRTNLLLLAALLALLPIVSFAVTVGDKPTTWFLTEGTSPSGLSLTATRGTTVGWAPTRTLADKPFVWYSDAQAGDYAGGMVAVNLWTAKATAATSVKAEIIRTDEKGENAYVLGSATANLPMNALGKEITTFSIKTEKAPLNNDRLALRLTKVTGPDIAVGFNANDYDSHLTIIGGTTIPKPEGGVMTYNFINCTYGKYKDEEIFWTMDYGKTWKNLKEFGSVAAPGGSAARVYYCVGTPPKHFGVMDAFFDFGEYNLNNQGAMLINTTNVDAYGLSYTLELIDQNGKAIKTGLATPREKLFEAFAKEMPAEFQSCIKAPYRIVSPCQADFGTNGKNGHYFDAYVDEVWAKYATETKTPGGWTGLVTDGALTFTPPAGAPGNLKPVTMKKKPTTQEILLGTGELGGLPDWCAAFNRHVAADPADWRDPSKYYLAGPANYYAKFWHDHSVNGHAYGFCYDDFNGMDSLLVEQNCRIMNVNIYW